jgi:hypothetical protein
VARLRARVERAAALHRQAAAAVAVAAQAVDGYSPASAPAEQYAAQRDLAARLRAAAADLAPGWLGASLDAASATPVLDSALPAFVRLGQAHPLDDARFPVVAPLVGGGHLAIDGDARDPRIAGLLRGLILRLIAAAAPGTLRLLVVDAACAGETTAVFGGIAHVLPPPAVDHPGLRATLAQAHEWVRAPGGPDEHLLLVVASFPELTDGADLARIVHLARVGVGCRLHLVVAGWPPPPLTAETTQPPLPYSTQVSLRNPYAWVGDPPGATYSGSGTGPARLNSPVYLDADPPPDLIQRVCAEVAAVERDADRPLWRAPLPRWADYVTAAQQLDRVRRDAAKLVTEQTAALKRAKADLGQVRGQLTQQQSRIADLVRDGRPVPLKPMPPELAQAEAVLARQAGSAKPGSVATADPLTTAIPTGRVDTYPATGPIAGPPTQPRTRPPPPQTSPPTPPAAGPPHAAPPGPPQAAPPGPPYAGPPRGGTPTQQIPPPTTAMPTLGGRPDARPTPVSGGTAGPPYPGGPYGSPAGRPGPPPVSGMPHPVYVTTGAFPVVGAGPHTGLMVPVSGPPAPPPNPPPPAAGPRVPEAALSMLANARMLLSQVDMELSDVDARAHRPVRARNAMIYGLYAVLFAFIQLPMLAVLAASNDVAAAMGAPCGLFLVGVSFLLAWLTIGFAYRGPGGQPPPRNPLLGAVISLGAAAPAVAAIAWMIVDTVGG